MKITREYFKEKGCYDFYLQQDNKVFEITFGGNLDLYWRLKITNNLDLEEIINAMYDEVKGTFIITKENYFIYSLFEELYDDIKESRIFVPRPKPEISEESELDFDEDDFDIWEKFDENDFKKRNEYYKKLTTYQLLFDGETIEWHSDDEEYSVADRVTINKVDDTFVLEFTRPYLTESKRFSGIFGRAPNSVSIRFRNSGSTYDPYNAIFMRMYNKLQEYDPEYHQIHIEEINHQKKLVLKK